VVASGTICLGGMITRVSCYTEALGSGRPLVDHYQPEDRITQTFPGSDDFFTS